jgi:predicted phage-related endonuclease
VTTRRIGGSDIAALIGLSKYKNEADVYLRIVEGLELPWSKQMERGAAVEPLLRAYAQRTLGLQLETRESDYHAHPGNEFAGAQIDDLSFDLGWSPSPLIIEYKSSNAFVKGYGPDGSDIVPPHVRAQVAWQMACADRDLALVVVGFGTDAPPPTLFVMERIFVYPIERDGVFESYMLQEAEKFWNEHIVPRKPPDVTPLGKYTIKECA